MVRQRDRALTPLDHLDHVLAPHGAPPAVLDKEPLRTLLIEQAGHAAQRRLCSRGSCSVAPGWHAGV